MFVVTNINLWRCGDHFKFAGGQKPALIDVKAPFPYDEFVVVLEGEVTLTHADGKKQTFKKCENFLVPKGFLGTWDMPVHYREMIVVETKAWNEAEG